MGRGPYTRTHSILQFNVFSLGHRNDRPNVEWDESSNAKPPLQATHLQHRQYSRRSKE
jgi:hypothetical protein